MHQVVFFCHDKTCHCQDRQCIDEFVTLYRQFFQSVKGGSFCTIPKHLMLIMDLYCKTGR